MGLWWRRDAWAVLLLISAVLLFLIRGPIRSLYRAYDFSWNYLGTKAWLAGLNPYILENSLAMRGSDYAGFPELRGYATPYFPAVFPLTAPFATFAWPTASMLFLIALLLLLALLVWRSRHLLPEDTEPRFVLVALALFLMMHPLHTGVSLLQYSIPACTCALLILTYDLKRFWPSIAAAAFAALALAFKPQVGIVPIAYGLILWRPRFLFTAWAIYGVLTVIGAAPITWRVGLDWIGQIRTNVGSIAVEEQSHIYCCVNLWPVFEPMMTSLLSLLVTIGPPAVAAVVIGWAWLVGGRGRRWQSCEERLSLFLLIAAAVLLSMYTRHYNVVLLAPALLLYPNLKRAGYHRLIVMLYGALALFLQPLPIQGLFGRLVGNDYQQWTEASRLLWRAAIAPAPTYALAIVFLSLCLITITSTCRRRDASGVGAQG